MCVYARKHAFRDLREAPISQLELECASMLVAEDVFGLEIAVHDAPEVQVSQRRQDLCREIARVPLGKAGGARCRVKVLHDAVEEVLAGCQLHDKIQLTVCAVVVEQTHHVFVLDLQPNFLLPLVLDRPGIHVDDFDRHLLAGAFVHSCQHRPVAAPLEHAPQSVIVLNIPIVGPVHVRTVGSAVCSGYSWKGTSSALGALALNRLVALLVIQTTSQRQARHTCPRLQDAACGVEDTRCNTAHPRRG